MRFSHLRLTFMTASTEFFVEQLIETVESGVNWGITVAISFTAMLMAVTLIAFVIHYAKSR